MELYPAVDIEGGRVARAHGAMAEPLAALDAFTSAGTRWIHLVDMDRAYGRPDNHELIGAVLQAAAPTSSRCSRSARRASSSGRAGQ